MIHGMDITTGASAGTSGAKRGLEASNEQSVDAALNSGDYRRARLLLNQTADRNGDVHFTDRKDGIDVWDARVRQGQDRFLQEEPLMRMYFENGKLAEVRTYGEEPKEVTGTDAVKMNYEAGHLMHSVAKLEIDRKTETPFQAVQSQVDLVADQNNIKPAAGRPFIGTPRN